MRASADGVRCEQEDHAPPPLLHASGRAGVQGPGDLSLPVPTLPNPGRRHPRSGEACPGQRGWFEALAIMQVTIDLPVTEGLGGHTAPCRGAVRAVRHQGLRTRVVSLSLSGLPSSTQQSHAAGLAATGRGVRCFSEVVPNSLSWLPLRGDAFDASAGGHLVSTWCTVRVRSGGRSAATSARRIVSTTVGPLHVLGGPTSYGLPLPSIAAPSGIWVRP
jgi:hypothetical protein